MARNKERRDFTHSKLEELSKHEHHSADDKLFFDRMPIKFEEITIDHHEAMPEFSADALQGRMVLITGPHGSGKSSLLRCLTDNLNPKTGRVVYPSHLQCLQVSADPQLLEYMTSWRTSPLALPTQMLTVS